MRILLADDDADLRRLNQAFLSKLGHDCTLAVNGKEAVDLYRQGKPDAVLMDIDMPVMDGVAAVAIILSEDPQARVVFLSSLQRYPQGTPRNITEHVQLRNKPTSLEQMRAVVYPLQLQPTRQ